MKLYTEKIIIIIAIIIVYIVVQNTWIDVEEFNIKIDNVTKEFKGIRVTQISDTHLPSSGGFIDDIIESVEEAKPDIILMTGDLIDRTADIDESGLGEMCRRLSEIANCYAISGNHELDNDYDKWVKILNENNVEVLDNKETLFNKEGKEVAIMGIKYGSIYKDAEFENNSEIYDIPKILLAHNPANFEEFFSEKNKIIPDLVLCGHAHGGQIRIPFMNQGLFAPGQGILPTYTSGEYVSKTGGVMIVSRGLGNKRLPLRINNRVNIPVINLTI